MMWKEHAFKRPFTVLPYGTLHVHSALDNELWIVEGRAQELLPAPLGSLRDPFRAGEYRPWLRPQRDKDEMVDPRVHIDTIDYPIQLFEFNLTREAVRTFILSRSFSAIKFAWKSRKACKDYVDICLPYDVSPLEKQGNNADPWRVEQGQIITVIGFNGPTDKQDMLMHQHYHPLFYFDEDVATAVI